MVYEHSLTQSAQWEHRHSGLSTMNYLAGKKNRGLAAQSLAKCEYWFASRWCGQFEPRYSKPTSHWSRKDFRRSLKTTAVLLGTGFSFPILALAADSTPVTGTQTSHALHVAPIKISEKTTTLRDFSRRYLAWSQRVLLTPFKLRVKGAPWEVEASAFVEKAIHRASGEPSTETPADLAARGWKLVDSGCDDPLVLYLAEQANYQATDNWRESWKTCERAFQKVEENPAISRALARLIAIHFAEIKKRGAFGYDDLDSRAVEWTRESLADGSYEKDEDVICLYHQFRSSFHEFFERQYEALAEVYTPASLPEWVRRTLLGEIEIKRAWAARGKDLASKVTEEGWKGFKEHLEKARAELTQAWKLRPDRPEAATEMITVVMGGCGTTEETERLWFDRAIAAQIDYEPAYRFILWAYRPRWGGSHRQMLEFGKACLATRRFELLVPQFFSRACDDIASELEDWRPFYRSPEVAKPLIELSQALLNEPSRQQDKPMHLSLLAVNSWLVGDYALASQTLRVAGDKLHPDAIKKLIQYRTDEPTFRAETAILSCGAKAEFDNAEWLYQSGYLDSARTAYGSAAKMAGPAAATFLSARQAIVDFERQFASNAWVKLVPDPTLSQWNIRSGRWSVEPDGTLVNQGEDTTGMILFRGRVGPNLEMRGEFEIEARESCCQNLYIATNWRKEEREEWISCYVWQNGRAEKLAGCRECFYSDTENDPRVPIRLQPKNRFFVRSYRGKVTFQLNDQTVYEDHAPKDIGPGPSDSLIGFCAYKFCRKNTTRIRHIEIRRLPDATPAH